MIPEIFLKTGEKLVKEFETPLYAYDIETVRERFDSLNNKITYAPKKIHYALKANFNGHILETLKSLGCGIDTVSIYEVNLCLKLGFSSRDIIFTGNNVNETEIEEVHRKDVLINFESLGPLEEFSKNHPEERVAVRINPDVGAGHHSHTITGGPDSKFGIDYRDSEKLSEILGKYNMKLVGIHSHIGSGILDYKEFIEAAKIIFSSAELFLDFPIEFVDIGGGIGIPYKEDDPNFDLEKFNAEISKLYEDFSKKIGRSIELKIEPGRFLVAESGVLFIRVTNLKNGRSHNFVGTDSGFNHLARPTMYGSHHEIYNVSNPKGEKKKYWICGNICESGDVFAKDRMISEIRLGDILAIADAGAYGFSMASNYNLRPRPAEIVIDGAEVIISRKRENIEDLFNI